MAAARLPTNEATLTGAFGDQPREVEHGPVLAPGAVRGELVIVLVQRPEDVERDR